MTKWENLSEEEKNKWIDTALKIEFVKIMKECSSCKVKFPNGIMYRNGDKIGLNGDYLFHLHSTHGIFPELIWDEFKKRFDKSWYPNPKYDQTHQQKNGRVD